MDRWEVDLVGTKKTSFSVKLGRILSPSLTAVRTFTLPDFSFTVSDDVYDASAWANNKDVPTKNAVRNKFESIDAGGGISEAKAIAYAIALG